MFGGENGMFKGFPERGKAAVTSAILWGVGIVLAVATVSMIVYGVLYAIRSCS